MNELYFEYFETENSVLKVALNVTQTAAMAYIGMRVWRDFLLKNLALDNDSFHDVTILCNVASIDDSDVLGSQRSERLCF